MDSVAEPTLCFERSAQDAIAGFPANVNVAVALALAGVGAEKTQVEIWADPTITRNSHTITVTSDGANLTMKIEGILSDENPRTGRITPQSVIATLRRLTSTVVIGA